MSHSTTATTRYTISKYSKSHDKGEAAEWQHFTNPTISMVLDIKKSSTLTELESVRLRIIWSMDTMGSNTMDVDQREVLFEDIDLLTFSSSDQHRSLQNAQSLPLKAVYRDAVVGIRYQHPRVCPPGKIPTYRRFQMTFQSASAASQFIDSICSVCPCKENPTAPAPNQLRNMSMSINPNTSRFHMSTNNPRPLASQLSLQRMPTNDTFSSVPHSARDRPSSSNITASTVDISSEVVRAIPDPSPPSSSANSYSMPPPPPPSIEATTQSKHDKETPSFISTLQEATRLYGLSRSDLEDIVGDIVREDGFCGLLENLDSLWKVKGFLAI